MKEESKQWFEIAESDYDSAVYLFKGSRYPQAVYMLCQSIEKLLKSALIEFAGKAPKKIHRLENIASDTGLNFSLFQFDLLTELSKHYSRVRYPDISRVSYNTREKTAPIIRKGKEVYSWLREKLKNR